MPGKENGLDIEGIAVFHDRLFLGLRGSVIDSHALVLELPLSKKGKPKLSRMRRHFLDLGGLGIRDLVRDGDRLLVLAGPVNGTRSPFQLHAWVPGASGAPFCLGRWKEEQSKPEGICRLDRDGRRGLLAVYDSAPDRIDGSRFRADWFPLPTSVPAGEDLP